jgi:hypothetical protein
VLRPLPGLRLVMPEYLPPRWWAGTVTLTRRALTQSVTRSAQMWSITDATIPPDRRLALRRGVPVRPVADQLVVRTVGEMARRQEGGTNP